MFFNSLLSYFGCEDRDYLYMKRNKRKFYFFFLKKK